MGFVGVGGLMCLFIWRVKARFVAVFCLAALLSGCSSVFFYPTEAHKITPDAIGYDYEDVYLTSSDGVRLHGWLLLATAEEPRAYVYFLHGNAENVSTHQFAVHWLLGEGYSVFILDYRGFGKSEGSPYLAGALDDAEAGLRWVRARAAGKPLHVLGQSLGGALAACTVSSSTTPVASLTLDSAFASYRQIAREKLASSWLTWPLQWPLSWLVPGGPDAEACVSAIAVPKLVVHGEADPVVPLHHSEQIFRAAAAPKQRLVSPYAHIQTFVDAAHQATLLAFFAQAEAAPGSFVEVLSSFSGED